MRKCDIYRHQEQGMWKDKFALEITDRRFHSTATDRRLNRRIESRENRGTSVISLGSFITADHNRRLRPRYLNQPSLNGGFERRSVAADCNRRIKLENICAKRQFQFGGQATDQTAVSPLMVKPKEKPRHSPKAIFALNQAHFRACANVSEQHRETNYKTHKTHKDVINQSGSV